MPWHILASREILQMRPHPLTQHNEHQHPQESETHITAELPRENFQEDSREETERGL